MISGQACGKFILLGEHSVVHQGHAISFPLTSTLLSYNEIKNNSSRNSQNFIVNGQKLSQEDSLKLSQLRERLLEQKSEHFKDSIEINTQIPIGAGLGSSAALCTALLRAHGFTNLPTLAEKAYIGESLFHGQASGVDPYTIALESILDFSSSPREYNKLEDTPIRENELAFLLLDSSKRHRTKDIIESTQRSKNEDSATWKKIIDNLAQISQEALKIWNQNFSEIGPLMNQAHQLLTELSVSDDALDQLVLQARKAGALGAKLTGAGRGGFVVALFPAQKIQSVISEVFPKVKSIVWSPK